MAIHAWVCGVDDYTSWDESGAADLRLAVSDATLVDQHLRDLGATVSIHVAPRGRSRAARTATRRRMLAGLRAALARAAEDPQGVFVLAFFGHGAVDDAGRAFLCPADVRPGLRGAVALETVRRIVDRALPGRPAAFLIGAAFGPRCEGEGRARSLTPSAEPVRPTLRDADVVVPIFAGAEPDPWWTAEARAEEALRAVLTAVTRTSDKMEIAATHTGFRICRIASAQGEPLGRFVVTDASVDADGWHPSKDYWLWDTDRPWPDAFVVRDLTPMLLPYPPEAPYERHVEAFDAGTFGAARAMPSPAAGALYELFTPAGRPRDAWLWRDPAPMGRHEWFATQPVGGYLDFADGDALVFRRSARTVSGAPSIELTRFA